MLIFIFSFSTSVFVTYHFYCIIPILCTFPCYSCMNYFIMPADSRYTSYQAQEFCQVHILANENRYTFSQEYMLYGSQHAKSQTIKFQCIKRDWNSVWYFLWWQREKSESERKRKLESSQIFRIQTTDKGLFG